jgi:hypothetical protein
MGVSVKHATLNRERVHSCEPGDRWPLHFTDLWNPNVYCSGQDSVLAVP